MRHTECGDAPEEFSIERRHDPLSIEGHRGDGGINGLGNSCRPDGEPEPERKDVDDIESWSGGEIGEQRRDRLRWLSKDVSQDEAAFEKDALRNRDAARSIRGRANQRLGPSLLRRRAVGKCREKDIGIDDEDVAHALFSAAPASGFREIPRDRTPAHADRSKPAKDRGFFRRDVDLSFANLPVHWLVFLDT